MSGYLDTVESVYAEAAENVDESLCCTTAPLWRFPDLHIPNKMLAMNYGCGSTVDPRDLKPDDTILYVGVGGGLEALQFAYCTRRPGGVIAIDPVAEMREKAKENFEEAARLNEWFETDFVKILDGSAMQLPVDDNSVTVVAQNCLFNVFKIEELEQALAETFRVLNFGGMFSTSDPITPIALPEAFRDNEIARARCLSGCQTFEEYLATITRAGFGRVEVRDRFPYRHLHPREYPELNESVLLESVEVAAFKVPDGPDGPAIFSGRTATYIGDQEQWRLDDGQIYPRGIPQAISDDAVKRFEDDVNIVLTPPTFHCRGGGCC